MAKTDLTLTKKHNLLYSSYEGLTTLQAWRATVLEKTIGNDAISFFLEAQNDALLSHTQASLGSWRLALNALRSLIENILAMVYYMDHPIEMELWSLGRNKIGFTDLIKYLSEHPRIRDKNDSVNGIDTIKTEYAKLSRAVHASSTNFRMTNEGRVPLLCTADKSALNKWRTRERLTLTGLNLALLCIFSNHLTGAKTAR